MVNITKITVVVTYKVSHMNKTACIRLEMIEPRPRVRIGGDAAAGGSAV